MSFHTVFAPLAKHYTVSKQTACSMTKPNTGLSGAVLLVTPFLLGESSVYLVSYLFFLVLVFFVCFFGTHFKKHWNFIWAFYRFK